MASGCLWYWMFCAGSGSWHLGLVLVPWLMVSSNFIFSCRYTGLKALLMLWKSLEFDIWTTPHFFEFTEEWRIFYFFKKDINFTVINFFDSFFFLVEYFVFKLLGNLFHFEIWYENMWYDDIESHLKKYNFQSQPFVFRPLKYEMGIFLPSQLIFYIYQV